MKNKIPHLIILLLSVHTAQGQVTYWTDILNNGFKQATIVQPSDYEGSVTCTIIRKLPVEKSRKAVLYIHGFNDYFFQEEMADRFISEGFNFYAVDLRKYGRSWLAHQKLNNMRDLSEYFPDIDTVLHIIKSEGSSKILLSGHAMGGLIVSLYADARNGNEMFDAVLLNSPFFVADLKSKFKKSAVGYVVKRAEKHPETPAEAGLSTLYGESLHKDYHGEWSYNLSWKPVEVPAVNFGWIRAIHEGQVKLSQGLQINKPVLVLHSAKSVDEKKWSDAMFTGDAVLNVAEIAQQARNIIGQYSIEAIPGGMHDLVLSRKSVRDDVYMTIFNWARRTVK